MASSSLALQTNKQPYTLTSLRLFLIITGPKKINPSVPEFQVQVYTQVGLPFAAPGSYCLTITVIAVKFHAPHSLTTKDDPMDDLIQQMFGWWIVVRKFMM